MKISLLLDREPFGTVVEETLSRYLSAVSRKPQRVSWREGTPKITGLLAKKPGLWLCNPEINAIFSVGADLQVFKVPWREYLRSPSPFRAVAQGGYLAAATAPVVRWFLASHHLWMDPELVNAQSTLILGGNTRLRILDFERGVATSVLKSGFDDSSMRRELEFRRRRDDVLAPPILEVLDDGRAMVEPLIQGTNADRLFNRARAEQAMLQALHACIRLGSETQREQAGDEWLARVLKDCQRAADKTGDNPEGTVQGALDLAAQLGEMISGAASSSEWRVKVGESHGDLQPGNIMVEGGRTWLIDWERVGARVLDNDALTLALRQRRYCEGFVERSQDLIEGRRDDQIGQHVHTMLNRDGGPEAGRLRLLMFFLEEVQFHLEEDAMASPNSPTRALVRLVEELKPLGGSKYWNV